MTIDLRILTMPGRSTSGFHQPGRRRGGAGGGVDKARKRVSGVPFPFDQKGERK